MKSQLEISTTPGTNHTGLALHTDQMEAMVEGAREFPPTSSGSAKQIDDLRIAYAHASKPHATMPISSVAPDRLPLLDKLGARLQFERTGTRLYDALIAKLDAYGSFDGGPTRAQLIEIREQELAHALLLQDCVRTLGGDPTAITPCASLQATTSRGIGEVLIDPRTSFIDSLEAILIAELADHESWVALARSVEPFGDAALIKKVTAAKQTEVEHLTKIRRWIEAADQARTKALQGKPVS